MKKTASKILIIFAVFCTFKTDIASAQRMIEADPLVSNTPKEWTTIRYLNTWASNGSSHVEVYQSVDGFSVPCASFYLTSLNGDFTNEFVFSKESIENAFGITNTCKWDLAQTYFWLGDQNAQEQILFKSNPPSKDTELGLMILLVLASFSFIFFIHNSMKSKKPWY